MKKIFHIMFDPAKLPFVTRSTLKFTFCHFVLLCIETMQKSFTVYIRSVFFLQKESIILNIYMRNRRPFVALQQDFSYHNNYEKSKILINLNV